MGKFRVTYVAPEHVGPNARESVSDFADEDRAQSFRLQCTEYGGVVHSVEYVEEEDQSDG